MDDARTVWCGNLAEKVTEELLYELFLQAAPLERVKIPTDREGRKSNFGFITFKHEVSVEYALQLLNGTRLFDRHINVKPRSSNQNHTVNRNFVPRIELPLPAVEGIDLQYHSMKSHGEFQPPQFDRAPGPDRNRDFNSYRKKDERPRDYGKFYNNHQEHRQGHNFNGSNNRQRRSPYDRRHNDRNRRNNRY